MTRERPGHTVLLFTYGVACQITQVVLLREFLTVFHGNELSLGIILGAWMLWVGVGSLAAARYVTGRRRAVSSRAGLVLREERARSYRDLSWVSIALLLLPILTVIAIRSTRAILSISPGTYLSVADMIVVVGLFTAPTGVLLGAFFVLAVRSLRLFREYRDTSAGSRGYIAEAMGNTVGGLSFTLLLVHFFGSLHLLVGVSLLSATIMLIIVPRSYVSRGLFVLVLLAAASLPALTIIDEAVYRVQWAREAPGHDLLEVRPSRYGLITVAHRDGQYSFRRSGNVLFSFAADEDRASLEEEDALLPAHLAMAQNPEATRVLLIGGGFRGILRELARYDLKRLDYVELDPELTAAALQYAPRATAALLDREEIQLIHGDARMFLRDTGNVYDVILVDVPDPATAVLNRYYTVEFFAEAARRLSPGGVLVTSADSTADLRGSAIVNRNATVYHSLRRVFPEVTLAGERRMYFLAGTKPGVTSVDPRELYTRLAQRGVDTGAFSPRRFALFLRDDSLRRVNWIIRHHGRGTGDHLATPASAPLLPPSLEEQDSLERDLPPVQERYFINSDFRSPAYIHTLGYWSSRTRGGDSRVLRRVLSIRPWWALVGFAVVVSLALALRLAPGNTRRRSLRFALLLAVFTTGLSTMLLQVAILFAFQNVYGYVYEMVGLIIAGFMAGLAAGTSIARRCISNQADLRVLAALQGTIALAAVGIAIALPRAPSLPSAEMVFAVFMLITFFSGFLNGLDFPVALACYNRDVGDADGATGAVYGTELLGACLGAVGASVVLAPVFGIAACAVLAAGLNGTAFGVLVLNGRPYG